jgi:hypothetical protein
MKDLAYYQENWDYRHFLAYAYIAVANSDYEITEEDLNEIHNKLAPSIFNEKEYQEMYHEVLKVYNKQNDNEVFQFLESLCEKHISSEDQKQKLLKDIQDIIDDDGHESGNEHIMLMSIKKILNSIK